MTASAGRLRTLDLLRGFAALAVAWFHFTNGNEHFLHPGFFKSSGANAWLGVEVFFVISGFIIPYALHRSGYRLADYGRFVLKRIVRLDPPYLASIALILVVTYVGSHLPAFRGPPFQVDLTQLALHLAYLNVWFGYSWLNPVFWTLAIEFQYYLLVGLLLPLIATRNATVRISTLACLSLLALVIPQRQFVCHWLFLFMLGMSTFQFRVGFFSWRVFVAHLALLTGGACYIDGPLVAIAGAATACAIAFLNINRETRWMFLGRISYSMYLVHVPIGGRVINLADRLPDTLTYKLLGLFVALLATIVAAALFYHFIERPAQHWSARIGYRQPVVAPTGFGPRTG
jgi:peptidoglycan/LPS O-acetylase OafA/YrhL